LIALAFLNPLLTRPSFVVEGDDILGPARHVGDDETDAWLKFSRMPHSTLATTRRGFDQLPA
jgi:hypothetical protein